MFRPSPLAASLLSQEVPPPNRPFPVLRLINENTHTHTHTHTVTGCGGAIDARSRGSRTLLARLPSLHARTPPRPAASLRPRSCVFPPLNRRSSLFLLSFSFFLLLGPTDDTFHRSENGMLYHPVMEELVGKELLSALLRSLHDKQTAQTASALLLTAVRDIFVFLLRKKSSW
jgi:hypothetical protein